MKLLDRCSPEVRRNRSTSGMSGRCRWLAIVASLTQWALVDRETGKLARVPVEVAAPFLSDDTAQKKIG